jgi:hypothetical protein
LPAVRLATAAVRLMGVGATVAFISAMSVLRFGM